MRQRQTAFGSDIDMWNEHVYIFVVSDAELVYPQA